MFQAFDFGDPTMVNAKRATTTVAPQALYIMNSPFAIEQALSFAISLLTKANATDSQRVDLAYLRAFARPAVSEESNRALSYLGRYQSAITASEPNASKRIEKAWTSFCQILLASNEFIYIR